VQKRAIRKGEMVSFIVASCQDIERGRCEVAVIGDGRESNKAMRV
jgi:hypothetical protein